MTLQWHCPTISFSVVLFSSCLHTSPTSGSFPGSLLFSWDGQVLEPQLQDLFLLSCPISDVKWHLMTLELPVSCIELSWGLQAGKAVAQNWTVLSMQKKMPHVNRVVLSKLESSGTRAYFSMIWSTTELYLHAWGGEIFKVVRIISDRAQLVLAPPTVSSALLHVDRRIGSRTVGFDWSYEGWNRQKKALKVFWD